MSQSEYQHESWSSRSAFLLSAIGFAVGLGNIWRFPYITGENGGGAFILIYLGVVLMIGAPLVAAELLIGRRGKLSPIGSLTKVASEAEASSSWRYVGHVALAATFLILTFYSVVAGWALDYLFRALTSGFAGWSSGDSEAAFSGLMASPLRLVIWQIIVVAITAVIITRGLTGGIEKAAFFLMPLLFIILIGLAIFGMTTSGFGEAASFIFKVDFSKVRPETFLTAIGQAFFSVGIAMGGMMTYGAYMPKNIKIPSSSVIIVLADTLVALIAGLAVFPIVFAFDLPIAQGTGLVFQTLPLAFGEMQFGGVLAVLFFVLLSAAAITSTIANFEPLASWAEEHRGLSRAKGAVFISLAIIVVGSGSVLSFNLLADFHPLAFIEKFSDSTLYDLTDFLASNILLPVGAALTAIFVGWVMKPEALLGELEVENGVIFKTWRFLLRFVAPIAILSIMAYALFG